MKHVNLPNHPDVVMIYQDKDTVESAITQIMELEVEFKTYKFSIDTLHDIVELKPKVVLLSSNNVKNTIQFYIDYLEEYEQNIAPHSAILLINNKEKECAFLACENGLFDNYAIINPLNDPYRLKLVLLHELKIIESHKNNSIEKLISDGEDQLASCIEHGVTLKRSFTHEVSKCEGNILAATSNLEENVKAKEMLSELVGVNFGEMNESISANIDDILQQMVELKINSQSIKQNIESYHAPRRKTALGVNPNAFTEGSEQKHKTSSYKILIAEPSDLFSRVIEEIFAETVFKYLLVNDGKDALNQIEIFEPDVVLLAYDLPSLNGLEITQQLRAMHNHLPIIAYIHDRDKKAINQWIPYGLSSYLIKPSKKSIILKSVTKAVKHPIDIIPGKSGQLMQEIKWLPEYSVGNAELDEQHKMLFTMTNDFLKQEGKAAAVAIFDNLISYIDLHFECEENLLRQINYPKTEEHVIEHNKLREKFLIIKEKLTDYDLEVHHKVAMFLYKWLAKHIIKSDMEFKEYALSIEEESFKQ